MDHITYPTSAADQRSTHTMHLSLAPILGAGDLVPDLDLEDLALGAITIPLRLATLLLIDGNGNERQVRFPIPARPWKETLHEQFARRGLELAGIDVLPGETRNITITI